MHTRFFLSLAALFLALGTSGVEAAPARKAKAAGKVPAELTIINDRKVVLSELAVSTEAGVTVGKLDRPLPPGKKVTMKLGKGAACAMTVAANFEDDNDSEGATDICKDRVVRLHD